MAPFRARRRRSELADRPVVWGRRKMLGLLAAGAGIAGLLVLGLVLAVLGALRPAPHPAASARPDGRPAPAASAAAAGRPEPRTGAGEQAGVAAERDALAARPMPQVPPAASHPMPVSLADPGEPILLPPATGVGPAGVPTGFGPTPAGAVGQLAAIDTAALASAGLPGVRAVIAGWAVPGGPTTSSWSGVRAVAGLLDAAGMAGGTGQLAVVATPLMALVKGTVGGDFVVACVDFEVDVTVTSTARGAVADCQRLVWTTGRWMIGAGPEPAEAPSVWPDTDLARQAGYRDLRRG